MVASQTNSSKVINYCGGSYRPFRWIFCTRRTSIWLPQMPSCVKQSTFRVLGSIPLQQNHLDGALPINFPAEVVFRHKSDHRVAYFVEKGKHLSDNLVCRVNWWVIASTIDCSISKITRIHQQDHDLHSD